MNMAPDSSETQSQIICGLNYVAFTYLVLDLGAWSMGGSGATCEQLSSLTNATKRLTTLRSIQTLLAG